MENKNTKLKRLVYILLTVLFLMGCLTSCGGAGQKKEQEGATEAVDSVVKMPTYDPKGKYTGFWDIDEDGDPDEALARGCYVVDHSELIGGREAWETFLAKAEKGENAFLRIAIKLYPDQVDGDGIAPEGTMFYDDLYYYEGKYYFFTYNGAGDIRSGGPYTYLRKLEGMSGNPKRENDFYVLTDSLELTYRDVEWSFLSSNLDTVTKIPFQWLGFTVYMKIAEEAEE